MSDCAIFSLERNDTYEKKGRDIPFTDPVFFHFEEIIFFPNF